MRWREKKLMNTTQCRRRSPLVSAVLRACDRGRRRRANHFRVGRVDGRGGDVEAAKITDHGPVFASVFAVGEASGSRCPQVARLRAIDRETDDASVLTR